MQNSKNVTIEELATLLNGKIWEKGSLKRIYINKGYNTKKMKTTVYVFINESNEICVSCFIDCPSQPLAWCNSQKTKIIESVENEIIEALKDVLAKEDVAEKMIKNTETDNIIEIMLSLEPLNIVKNPYYNPKFTPFKSVVNLTETPFIKYYKGAGVGWAFINHGKMTAFYYKEDAISVKHEGEKVMAEFSATQICFRF